MGTGNVAMVNGVTAVECVVYAVHVRRCPAGEDTPGREVGGRVEDALGGTGEQPVSGA